MEERRHAIEIPWRALAKLAAVVLGVWALFRLWPLVLVFFVAVLIAVTLEPAVSALRRRGIRRTWAVALVSIAVLGLFGAGVGLLAPELARDAGSVVQKIPSLNERLDRWAAHSPAIASAIADVRRAIHDPKLRERLLTPAPWESAATAIFGVPLVLIVALYLLADGPRTYAWLLAYVPREKRAKVGETSQEIAKVVHAYVRGLAITSGLVGIYSFTTLRLLHVPGALVLAVIAAFFDIIPLVGFLTFSGLAVLMALAVSPLTALVVAVLYVAYHLLESYVIVPRVYGKRMRLSTLTVIVALGVGVALWGVLGAVLALPFFAAYPIVERIWFRRTLGGEAIEDHEALDRAMDEKSSKTVERVIQGEEHPPPH